jgi:hypothetical protein
MSAIYTFTIGVCKTPGIKYILQSLSIKSKIYTLNNRYINHT